MKISVCIILALFVSVVLFAEEKVSHVPKTHEYKDSYLNIAFPAAVGKFRKVEVRQNNNPAIGNIIRYQEKLGACADVYIYQYSSSGRDPGPADLKKEFDLVTGVIERMVSSKGPVTSLKILLCEQTVKPAGHRLRFRYEMNQMTRFGEVVIFSKGKYIVKLRLSSPSNWPEISSIENFTDFFNGISQLLGN